jgi:uncharacterized zinc-type alcohol dehydrogenase-like protein
MVPGHEIAGRVVKVGKGVTKFKVGDFAGVGCLVNACGVCEHCQKGEEQYCDNNKRVMTYAGTDYFHGDVPTQGGYSDNMVLSERYAIKIPKDAQMEKVAPLLCAGITTYSPLQLAHLAAGDKVAIAGFGGLGHMAVQYAVALGAEVTVFDITENKRKDALEMGAKRYVNVTRQAEMKGLDNQFRVVISTIPARYEPAQYLKMLKVDGEMVILGLPATAETPSIDLATLVWFARRKVYGSQIGGIRETQEMMDYSVKNNLYPRVELIPIQKLDEAYRKVLAGEVKFRYVIDMKTLRAGQGKAKTNE